MLSKINLLSFIKPIETFVSFFDINLFPFFMEILLIILSYLKPHFWRGDYCMIKSVAKYYILQSDNQDSCDYYLEET
jgi:hypothetical protein